MHSIVNKKAILSVGALGLSMLLTACGGSTDSVGGATYNDSALTSNRWILTQMNSDEITPDKAATLQIILGPTETTLNNDRALSSSSSSLPCGVLPVIISGDSIAVAQTAAALDRRCIADKTRDAALIENELISAILFGGARAELLESNNVLTIISDKATFVFSPDSFGN